MYGVQAEGASGGTWRGQGVTDSSAQAVGLTGSVVFLEEVFHQQMGLKP